MTIGVLTRVKNQCTIRGMVITKQIQHTTKTQTDHTTIMEAEEAVMEVAHIEFDVTSVYVSQRNSPKNYPYSLLTTNRCAIFRVFAFTN